MYFKLFILMLLFSLGIILLSCNNSNSKDSSLDEENNIANVISLDKNKEVFGLEEIKGFILEAKKTADSVIEGDFYDSRRVIGLLDESTDLIRYAGKYNTFDKVIILMGKYYTNEMIEKELYLRYLVNLDGIICNIEANGELNYFINEDSHIWIIKNESDKKVVKMEAFDDEGDIHLVQYTLEKQERGSWVITKMDGYMVSDNIITDNLILDKFIPSASSYLDNYPPEYVIDENYDTAWAEGVEGNGTNEWILLEADEEIEVNGMQIINGYLKTWDLYLQNNRLKKIVIEFSDNSTMEKELNNEMFNFQNIDFNKTIKTQFIKIIIVEVYEGSIYDDTCISEIRIY